MKAYKKDECCESDIKQGHKKMSGSLLGEMCSPDKMPNVYSEEENSEPNEDNEE